ncbi:MULTISPECIES: cytochrome B6 [unclassified Mesorhizobium]|uniref:cytochrome B6 n=1 Tax=unclassified Mesorhizobium TaxID=325217 RepID=UPI00112782BA|nr:MULTISPECIES: cytochrome B6 [unclassified Mesorhizobium]MBZ9921868.1 cytochrome B6 [Mesorhizobium sp. BR1-1-7]MBZ9954907.1 cytochrome B6 [Mesorhizobium sp. BR1-1-15]MBZ9970892.1 cytochrome B6 [Mesorhizobium sp. BR1-1-12]MCA0060354.1 cytochrome B6 [Mesorhizobium sp. B261B1A]TPK38627.1 cytochrome B6 [Mesorhizobium sp. B2-5-3]
MTGKLHIGLPCAIIVAAASISAFSDPLPPDITYRPLPSQPFSAVKADDEAQKPGVMERQKKLLEQRYDLADRPIPGVMMTDGKKPVQGGVRVKLAGGSTWDRLSSMSPGDIRDQGLLPAGFLPLPHVKQAAGGQVFPEKEIREIGRQEGRDLRRFDVDFDLPDHLTPEFPPPIFLTTHPELGDVSRGELLTIRNYYEIMNGIITPVQMEGLRLLLTPFPQEEFNQTEDRKVAGQSMGVACLDCHSNFNTNAAFHQTPDIRPQAARFRLDTTSLRGLFNQQIHGSKRSLRSVEDFTEFEQRTAYFNGDHVSATRKGVNLPDRPNQVAMMAQMQNIIDFPPAPKLDPFGRLDPALASAEELKGEAVFMGKGRCSQCHNPQTSFMDNNMHDLKLDRFYKPGQTVNDMVELPDGPIKTFTLRGIKDTPPYLHDGRLMTLADTVEFFNLVLGTKLDQSEKDALVAYLLVL